MGIYWSVVAEASVVPRTEQTAPPPSSLRWVAQRVCVVRGWGGLTQSVARERLCRAVVVPAVVERRLACDLDVLPDGGSCWCSIYGECVQPSFSRNRTIFAFITDKKWVQECHEPSVWSQSFLKHSTVLSFQALPWFRKCLRYILRVSMYFLATSRVETRKTNILRTVLWKLMRTTKEILFNIVFQGYDYKLYSSVYAIAKDLLIRKYVHGLRIIHNYAWKCIHSWWER